MTSTTTKTAFTRTRVPAEPELIRPASAYGLLIPVVALFCVGMVIANSLIGPFITMTLPFMLAVGFAIGPLHRLATEAPRRRRAPRVSRQVSVRAMRRPAAAMA